MSHAVRGVDGSQNLVVVVTQLLQIQQCAEAGFIVQNLKAGQ